MTKSGDIVGRRYRRTKISLWHTKGGRLLLASFRWSTKNMVQPCLKTSQSVGGNPAVLCDWSVTYIQICWPDGDRLDTKNGETYQSLWRRCCTLWSCCHRLL